jgi:hypothetical protein
MMVYLLICLFIYGLFKDVYLRILGLGKNKFVNLWKGAVVSSRSISGSDSVYIKYCLYTEGTERLGFKYSLYACEFV